MKIGDKVTVRVFGAGVFSDEDWHIIEEIDDISLKVEDLDYIFVKNIKGDYITATSTFGFWFKVKGDQKNEKTV